MEPDMKEGTQGPLRMVQRPLFLDGARVKVTHDRHLLHLFFFFLVGLPEADIPRQAVTLPSIDLWARNLRAQTSFYRVSFETISISMYRNLV